MKKVIEFLRNNLKEKDSLVVACSGGPDSMCLLDLVTKLKDELNLTIVVAHVNHKLRIESDEEAKMVEKYAKDHNLIFELMELNEYLNNTFTESDGRKTGRASIHSADESPKWRNICMCQCAGI